MVCASAGDSLGTSRAGIANELGGHDQVGAALDERGSRRSAGVRGLWSPAPGLRRGRRGGEEDGRVTVVEVTPAGEELARRFLAELEALRASRPPRREANAALILYEIAKSLERSSDSAAIKPA